tara:strand:- start:137 stop:1000 length:864 start_codon:yes stop_codon:yes gene_type:complete
MSKILKRPMFRKGGPAMTGIMSGIKPRQNYAVGEDVQAYRDEFTEAYGSVPSGGAFDPLTQLLIGFGQKAMTTPSSGNVLQDLVEASKDPSKQFFKAKSKEAADKRNVQLAATKFGLTEAGKDRRLDKRIEATLAGKESPEDKLKTNLTSEFFATYDDLGKAKNRAEFEVDIKGKMAEKFGASQVSFGLDKADIVKKAKQKKNVGKAFYNLEEGNIIQVLPNGEVAIINLTELGTYEGPTQEQITKAAPAYKGADSDNPSYRRPPKPNFFKTLEPVDPFDTDVSSGA